MIYLARRYKQKPRQWGPPSSVSRAAIDNCEALGLPRPRALFPFWEGSGNIVNGYGIRPCQGTLQNASWGAGHLDLTATNAIMYASEACAYDSKGAVFQRMTGIASPVQFAKFFTFADESTELGFKVQRYNLDTVLRVGKDDGSAYVTDLTGAPDAWGSGMPWYSMAFSWFQNYGFHLKFGDAVKDMAGDDLFALSGTRSSYFCVGNRLNGLDRGLRAKFEHTMIFDDPLNAHQIAFLEESPWSILQPTPQRTIFDLGRAPAENFVDLAASIEAQASISADMSRYAGLETSVQAITGWTASVSVDRAMSASMTAMTSILASLSTDAVSYVDLIASVSSMTSASAAMSVTRDMAAQVSAVTDIVAGLARTVAMGTQIGMAAGIDAGLDRQPGFSASLGAVTAAAGALDRRPGLGVSVEAVTSASGVLGVLRGMQVSLSAVTEILAHFILGTVVSQEDVLLQSSIQMEAEMLSSLQLEVERLSSLTRQLTVYVQLTE